MYLMWSLLSSYLIFLFGFFFFKQNPAYDMRISDWSSDVCSADLGEAALRSVPGVRSATTSSLALGGTSVMAVSYMGTVESLRAALSGRGWDVAASGNTLRIQRRAQPPASAEAPATGQ